MRKERRHYRKAHHRREVGKPETDEDQLLRARCRPERQLCVVTRCTQPVDGLVYSFNSPQMIIF